MSLEIIIQEIRVFGKLLPDSRQSPERGEQKARRFRMTLGNQTYLSQSYGFCISEQQYSFDESFSLFYDNRSITLWAEIFSEHSFLNNEDLEEVLCAEFDLSDITSMVGERVEATCTSVSGKMAMLIEVFKRGPRFSEKVTSSVLFEAVREEKLRRVQASSASRNIKSLMVSNALTNSLMTINSLEVRPDQEEAEMLNRDCFVLVRQGLGAKAYSGVARMAARDGVAWGDYLEFMKNDDAKFEFFLLFYDELGSLVCRAKGEIKYIVFDETVNCHTLTLFDRRSAVYADLLVKFAEKEVEAIDIRNPLDKRLRGADAEVMAAIDEFNAFKFQSQNNTRILSEKLRELELRKIQEQEEKMRPLDPQELKKKEEHGRFIDFLQKEMIKIERQLKKRELQEKKDIRKNLYMAEKLSKKQDLGKDNASQFAPLQTELGQGLETNRQIQSPVQDSDLKKE